nr:unnamed protein product [Callosobruchus analis]
MTALFTSLQVVGTMAARHRPRYLDEIMEVIVNMKEVKGSTSRRILDRVHNLLVLKRKKGKVDPLQIKKALAKGVECGVLRKKDGKYRLGLDAKDYVIYRNWAEKHTRQARRVDGARRHRRERMIRSKSLSLGRQRERRSSSSYEADDYESDTTGESSHSDSSCRDNKRDGKDKKKTQKKGTTKKGKSGSKSSKDSRMHAAAEVADKSVTSIKGNNSRSKSRSATKIKNHCSNEIYENILRSTECATRLVMARKYLSNDPILFDDLPTPDYPEDDDLDEGEEQIQNDDHDSTSEQEYDLDGKAPDNKQAPYCGNPDCLCNLCVENNEAK